MALNLEILEQALRASHEVYVNTKNDCRYLKDGDICTFTKKPRLCTLILCIGISMLALKQRDDQ